MRLVADSAPRVDVPVPGVDTMAPLSLLVPLVVDVRDDHGITSVVLESRRISPLSGADSARREMLPLPQGTPDRAILTPTLDLNRRGLLPGDTVRYVAIAADNTPAHQTGRSREYVLRLPTMTEVRAAQREATEAVASQLDSVTAASQRLERETDDLGRERARPSEGQSGKKRRVAHLRGIGEALASRRGITATAHPAGRAAEAIDRCAPQERRGGGHQRLGVAARAVGDS